MIKNALQKQKVFTPEGAIALSYPKAVEKLLDNKEEGESIVDIYMSSLVLPCGTLHEHTLKTLQDESSKRLGYDDAGNWLKTLRERLTWHDVVLWLLLIELTKQHGYNPTHKELDLLKNIYSECIKDDKTRFNTIYGMMYIKGGDKKVSLA